MGRDHHAVPVAAARIVAPATAPARTKSDPIATIAAPSPALAPSAVAKLAEKITQRIDMTPTAAIPAPAAPKRRHRAHKRKPAQSEP